MRAWQRLILAMLFIPLAVARAAAADADPHADDRKELLKVFREIEASINAQSVDRMVQQMAPDATVTWLNGEVSRGHEEIKGYYNKMVRGEKRILDKYVTAAKVGAPAKFYGNGEVAVADGTGMGDRRLQRVLTADPGTGVMRHADAGYEDAIAVARERGVDLPMVEPRAG